MIRSIGQHSELHTLQETGSQQRPQQTAADQSLATQKTDSFELSEQARQLLSNPELLKQQRISAAIESGFYNSPDVLRTVAQRLLEDIGGSAMGTGS